MPSDARVAPRPLSNLTLEPHRSGATRARRCSPVAIGSELRCSPLELRTGKLSSSYLTSSAATLARSSFRTSCGSPLTNALLSANFASANAGGPLRGPAFLEEHLRLLTCRTGRRSTSWRMPGEAGCARRPSRRAGRPTNPPTMIGSGASPASAGNGRGPDCRPGIRLGMLTVSREPPSGRLLGERDVLRGNCCLGAVGHLLPAPLDLHLAARAAGRVVPL